MNIPSGFTLSRTGLSASLIATYATCPRKFLYKINRWKAVSTSSAALDFGSFVHEVLDIIYQMDTPPNTGALLTACEQVTKKLGDGSHVFKAYGVLRAYVETFGLDWKLFKDRKCEEVFAACSDVGLLFNGKRDMTFTLRKELTLFETKTKGQVNEDAILQELAFDRQIAIYALTDKSFRPKKVMYNIIRNPAHKQGKTETLLQFSERIYQEAKADLEHFFKRYEIDVSELVGTLVDVIDYVGMIQLNIERKSFPRNCSACIQYGACEFLPLCSSDSEPNGNPLFTRDKYIFPELKK